MAKDDENGLREQYLVDLTIWLEKTGHEGDTANIARRLFENENMACQSFDYHFDRIESDGILEVRFYFPFSRLGGIINLKTEVSELEKWFETVNNSEVTIDIGSHEKLGDCILVHRYHYIPKDRRNNWLGSSEIAVQDQDMLCKLLNRRKPQG